MSLERLAVWTQQQAPFEVQRFSVFEAVSRPFEVMLVLRCRDVNLDPEDFVNQPASFRMDSGVAGAEEPRRLWTGMCSQFELLRAEVREQGTRALSTYLMRIVPTLWQLRLSSDHRVFRHKSLVEIVEAVLGDWAIEATWRLSRSPEHYLPLEYIVQYGESDLDFVHRLLAFAGISYFFEHQQDATRLVLCDEPEHGPVRSGIDWEDEPKQAAELEFVTDVRLAHRIRPGRVSIRDYDFRQPESFVLRGEAAAAKGPEKAFEHYTYEPGAFRVKSTGSDALADEGGAWPFRHDPEAGERLAALRLASLRRGKRSVSARTNVVGLCPGRVLSLAGHPRDDLASDRALIVTEMQLDGRPDSTWLFSFEAEFADVPLLPHDKTKKPTIAGMQTAIVVGPKNGDGCEIYPDEHGRVKVQLSWDRRGEFDQNSGCWARVSQAWAGTRFGAMALPRVGNEVLVAYFDGDPDMPVVVGRAFNRTRPVPYGLPEHAEKTVFKTKTSPQSDKENAFNELRFDDRKGEELIYIQAQRDYQQLIKRNDTERTGKSRASVVGGSRTSLVGKVETRLVGKKYSIQMVEKPDAPAVAIEEMDELRLLAQLEPELRPLATKLELMHEEVLATSGPASLVMSDDEIVFNAEGEFSMEADGQIVIYGGPNIKINC